ncbi:MAG TPA: lamin tail domain-containing protein, partial [Anaerolineales bacterium]|nr:lamin tail domain-containing protein [Anaerolineales bacterium]
ADYVYGGNNLGNGPPGESLELYDAGNVLIDTVNSNGGAWPGGSGSPNYFSMERIDSSLADSDSNWGTNDGIIRNGLDANSNPINGTPGQPNSALFSDQVIISEVAWAGTQASAFDEWIELYNDGGSTVDLTNWRIQAADGDPLIPLSGNIAPGGYLVLERGSQNVTNVAGIVYSAGLFSDSGETLYLLDDTSATVDTVNSNGGAWAAGTGSPDFRTMERIGNVPDSDYVWVTFDDTPFALDAGGNDIYGTPGTSWGFTVIPTGTPTNTPVPPTTTPTGSLALLINEVAWAGTDASTSDEWIELYNPSAIAVNLSGWRLKATDGTPNISLKGTIPAGGYFLLERTDDTTVSDIVADQIYTGDLGNSYEVLQLLDPSNFVVDTANSNGGLWPAGSSTTRGSMERRGVIKDSDTAWITNTGVVANGLDANGDDILGTPKQPNWALTVTATPSPLPSATRTPFAYKTSTPKVPPPPPLVAINEFVPRPGHDWNNDGIINTGDEYIELLNHGVVDVNLSGYRLDDEANIGSSPFSLPSVVLKPGERIVFYGSQTGLLLSDGGDGVRLLKSNGQLVDAYNYFTVNFPDQSFCRLPDNGGLDDWNTNCYPTPGLRNSLSGSLLRPPTQNNEDEPLCPVADTLPEGFVLAECSAFGHNIWNRYYWDKFGWYNEMSLPNVNGKWDLFAD